MGAADTLRVRVGIAHALKQAHQSNDDRAKELIAALALALLGLTQKLAAGSITRRGFTNAATGALWDHMQQAAALSAGDAYHVRPVDALLASKYTYLDNFAADIASGAISDAQAAARAELWSGLAHTAYQMGKVQAMSDEAKAEIYWTAEDDDHTCPDCEALEAGSPYTLESLPTYPGDGATQCLSACRCSIDGPGGE